MTQADTAYNLLRNPRSACPHHTFNFQKDPLRIKKLLSLLAFSSFIASAQAVPPTQPGQLQGTIAAPQLSISEKFEYRIVQSFGLRNFVGAAIGAAIGQSIDSPHEWGQGVGGYAQRYGSAFAGTFARQAFAFTLETALKEDPRYFPLSRGNGFKARTFNALKQVSGRKTTTAVQALRSPGWRARSAQLNLRMPGSRTAPEDGQCIQTRLYRTRGGFWL